MGAISLHGVEKTYGHGPKAVKVIHGVDAEIADGEFIVIVGPSGCGKSTLLRLVAGLETPDGGSVALGSEDLTSVAPAKRGFGMVFQDFALFPHLDVAANVAFGLVEGRVPEPGRSARVAELLALVGLTGLERRRVHQLSGGQQQRVALARALAPTPRLLLLDEPLSDLDARLRELLKLELRTILAGSPAGAIYVTHDQVEAFTVADRVALMRGGALVQVGPGEELLEAPADAWAARFLGHENVFEGAAGARLPVSAPPGGAVLLRADRTRLVAPDAGGVTATVTAAGREGLAWRLVLSAGAWGVQVVWRGHDRELPERPTPGTTFGLVTPPDAWRALAGTGRTDDV